MIDWNPLIAAAATLLIALSIAVPSFISLLNAKLKAATDTIKKETDALAVKTDAVVAESKEIKFKVDGNYSDLKAEVQAAKAETMLANQRIAVLTERLITSTPAGPAPPSLILDVAPSTDER